MKQKHGRHHLTVLRTILPMLLALLLSVGSVMLHPFEVKAQTSFSSYIDLPIDIDGESRYKPEKIPVYFFMDDIWTNYYTKACVYLMKGDTIIESRGCGIVPADDTMEKLLSFKTNDLQAGMYTVVIVGMPCYSDGSLVDEIDADEWEMEDFDIYVRTLKSPKSLRTYVGKKKVTLTYGRSPGANKYEIYRSTRKSSGYKKIKTTTSLRYVDKKVKKGKRYYYKVRAVRTETVTTVRSAFCKAVRSKKVK